MALSIKDPEADRLARLLSQETGESLTEAVINSLKERLSNRQLGIANDVSSLVGEIMDIGRHCSKYKIKDKRSANQIIGYNRKGIPT